MRVLGLYDKGFERCYVPPTDGADLVSGNQEGGAVEDTADLRSASPV